MQTNKNRYSLLAGRSISEQTAALDYALSPVSVWFRPPCLNVCTLHWVMEESEFPSVIIASKTHLSN